MSGVRQCWDSAVVKGTFGVLKREPVHHERSATRAEASASLFEYVEVFDNRVRQHSTLGCAALAEYERTHNPNTALNNLSTYRGDDQTPTPNLPCLWSAGFQLTPFRRRERAGRHAFAHRPKA